MKTLLFILFIFPISISFANGNTKNIELLIKYYELLDARKADDIEKGSLKITNVESVIDEFGSNKKKSKQQLDRLVHLVSLSLPFDMESNVAYHLRSKVKSNKKLKEVFAQSVQKIKSNCHKKQLVSSVKTRACAAKEPAGSVLIGSNNKALNTCGSDFNFEKCLKAH